MNCMRVSTLMLQAAAPMLLDAADDALLLIANTCALWDLAALSRTCARLRRACIQRMAAVARLGAAPFNLSFWDVAVASGVDLRYCYMQDAGMVVLSAALASGAMANTKVSSKPSHSCSGLRLTAHLLLTLLFCTH